MYIWFFIIFTPLYSLVVSICTKPWYPSCSLALQLLELKGNIRVFCRIRPLLDSETGPDGPAVTTIDEETLSIVTYDGQKEASKVYKFDRYIPTCYSIDKPLFSSFTSWVHWVNMGILLYRVFGPDAGQEAVYNEVSSLVTSVLDGYNVCIMAYGQTGSGKTHTINGPAADPGVNTRSLHELFRLAQSHKDKGNYVIKASVLEIYNEQIVDLLSNKRDQKLDIKQVRVELYIILK